MKQITIFNEHKNKLPPVLFSEKKYLFVIALSLFAISCKEIKAGYHRTDIWTMYIWWATLPRRRHDALPRI